VSEKLCFDVNLKALRYYLSEILRFDESWILYKGPLGETYHVTLFGHCHVSHCEGTT